MKINSLHSVSLLAVLGLLAFTHAASAQIIYQDDFDGSSSDPLNGASPDIGAGTWTAGAGWQADGSYNTNTTAYLSNTFTSGEVYTYDLDLNPDTDMLMMWIGNTGTNIFGTANSVAIRLDSNGAGSSTLYTVNNGAFSNQGSVTNGLTGSIILDTTDPQWTVEFLYGGVSYGTQNFTPAMGVDVTAFGVDGGLFGNGVGNMDNLNLSTAAIPEPATGAMVLGGLGLLLLRRQRPAARACDRRVS